MEVTGNAAFVLVLVVFLVGLLAGFLWAGWSFTLILKKSGYKLGPENYIIPMRSDNDTGS